MGIVSKISKRIEVPEEPGQWIEIRMLSWLTLDKARKERMKELMGMRDLFVLLKDVTANGAAESVKAAEQDPLQSFDQLTLLRSGIVSWSYGEGVAPEELEEKTAKWAALEILVFTLPDEAQTKTPSSLSTGI
jgi:hypothetical protein